MCTYKLKLYVVLPANVGKKIYILLINCNILIYQSAISWNALCMRMQSPYILVSLTYS